MAANSKSPKFDLTLIAILVMNLIRLLLQYSRLYFALAVITGIFSGASAAGLIALINTILGRDELSVKTFVWLFASLCLLRILTNFTSQVLLIRLSQNAIFELRMRLSRQILASPLRHLETTGAHRLLATLAADIQAISDTAVILPFVFINIAIIIGCQIYLFYLSPLVFAIVLGFLAIGAISYQFPTIKALSLLRKAREQEDKLFSHFRGIILGAKELKLHRQRRQAFLSEELQTSALSYRRENVLGNTVYAAAASWGQSLFFVCIGLLLFTIPSFQNISRSVVSGYALTIIYVMTPLEYIARMMPPLSKAAIALKKIQSLGLSLTTEFPLTDSTAEESYSEFCWKSLELINVSHTYYQEREDTNFILGPIDLVFYPGEIVFIVGGNGSGKSTLAKLITGLYSPETGKICFDGQLINQDNLEWYRQQFSVVFSDFYLFERLLGLESLDLDRQVQHYLCQLQLDRKVQVQQGIISTTALSQGQRKRLALLTAYLENRPIYLFDEWAADQDPLFKKVFYTQLLPELKNRGKTVLVISHDDQYFYLGDRIIKLEYGQVKYSDHNCQVSS